VNYLSKMRNVSKGDAVSFIWIAVVIGVIYLLFKAFRRVGNVLDTKPSDIGLGSPDEATSGGSEDAVVVNQANLTMPIDQYTIIADEIEAAVWGFVNWSEDDEAFGLALAKMNSDDDVKQLIKAYGVRGMGFFTSQYLNLPQTVVEYLDDDVKARVNYNYSGKNMLFRWS